MTEKDIISGETMQKPVQDENVNIPQEVVNMPEVPVEFAPMVSEQPEAIASSKKSKKKLIAVISALGAVLVAIAVIVIVVVFGKSDAARAVDNQIKAIGTVSLESGSKIEAAEKAVDDLSYDDRQQLDRLDDLKDARKEYDKLVLKDKAKKVEDAISAIGTVTVNSAEKIELARGAYELAEDDIKEEVSNLDVLEAAEAKYNDLLVAETEKLIGEIGEVTLGDKETIAAARANYDKLSEENKEKVGDYYVSTLVVAEANLEMLEKEEKNKGVEKILASWSGKKDEVTHMSSYWHKVTPNYINTRSYFLPLIIKDRNQDYYCYIRANYTGENWIFWDKLAISIDGQTYYKSVNYSDVNRDNDYGDVWEYYAMEINEDNIEIIKQIPASSKTIIRFMGSKGNYDLIISEKDKQAIADAVKVYEMINN